MGVVLDNDFVHPKHVFNFVFKFNSVKFFFSWNILLFASFNGL